MLLLAIDNRIEWEELVEENLLRIWIPVIIEQTDTGSPLS